MDIVEVFNCNCRPGFNWKNRNTFKCHFKTNRHVSYQNKQQELEHRKNITTIQIEIDKLKRENEKLKELLLKALYDNQELIKNKMNVKTKTE